MVCYRDYWDFYNTYKNCKQLSSFENDIPQSEPSIKDNNDAGKNFHNKTEIKEKNKRNREGTLQIFCQKQQQKFILRMSVKNALKKINSSSNIIWVHFLNKFLVNPHKFTWRHQKTETYVEIPRLVNKYFV